MSAVHREGPSQTSTWPNLFLVGATKAGTTTLHQLLSRHAEIYMSTIKEPNFFTGVVGDLLGLMPVVRDAVEYQGLFASAVAQRWRGESSTSYLWDQGAADRIRDRCPDARILVLLRDPVDRAYSHFLMEVREGRDRMPFRRALEKDAARSETGWGIIASVRRVGTLLGIRKAVPDAFRPGPGTCSLLRRVCPKSAFGTSGDRWIPGS